MIETKDAILFVRCDGALVLYLQALRDLGPSEQRICYCAAVRDERIACNACGLMVRIVAESRARYRFVCLDCEDKELAETDE